MIMAEVHIIGEISHSKNFDKQHLFCKWYLQIGNNWRLLSGKKEGQTQVASNEFEDICKWSYPLDIHLATSGLQGWPKIYIQVFHLDWVGRSHLFGYGLITIPTNPGQHELDCYTWRPLGSLRERFVQYFMGGGPQLKDPHLILSTTDRYKLNTEAMGVISAWNITELKSGKMWLVFVALFPTALGNVTLDTIGDSYSDYSSSVTMPYSYSISEAYSSSELTEIDCNSSSCSNSTTTQVPISTTPFSPKTSKIIPHDFSSLSCLCNLHINACDVNCCCDEDCNYEMKSIFDHCDSIDSTNIDRRSCTYVEHDYVNFTLREWEIQSNDLFCVVKSNVPPSRTVQKEELLENYEESLLQKDSRYDWPERMEDNDMHYNYSVSYAQGLPIWVILNNSTIHPFKLSEALISSGCNIQTEVKYLYDVYNECVHAVKKDNNFLNFDYYKQFLFVAKPDIFNYTELSNKLMTCSGPTCLKTSVKICSDINLRNCTDNNSADPKFRCENELEKTTCKNVVKSLKYIFFHEGIKGLKHINLSIYFVNVTYESRTQYELEQSISVEFQWADNPTNFSNTLSGNPGYIVKRPILLGTLINGTISRKPDDYRDNFMVLPDEDRSECTIGKYSYQPIEFGYNSILMCRIRGDILVQKNSKATDVCKKVQLEVFKYWNIREFNGSFLNRSFGYFGNANSSITEDWKGIMYEKSPEHIRNHIIGKYGYKNKTLKCSGLTHGLNMNIYHARVDLKKLLDQEKILGITYQFQKTPNESITFSLNHSYLRYEFMLDTRVKFWDVTSPKVRKLLDPPSLNIELPSDFFYPFVKVGNGCRNVNFFENYFFVRCFIILSVFNIL